jgi:hypothetical protein
MGRCTPFTQYLKLIVEPTVEEFRRYPMSLGHCYLACAATHHSIDRAAELSKRRVANLRQVWGRQSREFKLVDIVAHDFKHIRASERGVRVPYTDTPLLTRQCLTTRVR